MELYATNALHILGVIIAIRVITICDTIHTTIGYWN